MSKFMEFLNDIDKDIVNETYVDESVIEAKEKPKKKVIKRTAPVTKKDSSVKLIEARIRTKLDKIGLNESAISEVVSFVLDDVQKVSEVKARKKVQPKTTPVAKKQPVKEAVTPNTIMGRAESLLSGLPDSPTMGPLPTQGSGDEENISESQFSAVADKASSLLG